VRRRIALAFLLSITAPPLAASIGCAADDDEARCDGGQELADGSCVPRLPVCDRHSIPIVGEGCKRIGVPRPCPEGFAEDGDSVCQPILSSPPCADGTLGVLGDVSCAPVGLTKCPPKTTGACDPILPATVCPAGSMALPGETTCREIAACGAGAFGDEVPAGAIHVDRSYTGASPDGSAARPFPTIQAAVDAASPSNTIVIAEGVYDERVTIAKPLRVQGRCPASVEVHGGFEVAATVELRKLAIRPAGRGVVVRAKDVLLDRVWIHDGTSEAIVSSLKAGSFTLRGSLVEQVFGAGLQVSGGTAVVESSVLRGVVRRDDKSGGSGVEVFDGGGKTPPSVAVTGSLIEANHAAGLFVSGAQLTLKESVVRDNGASADATGEGIAAQIFDGIRAEVTVEASILERNKGAAVRVLGSNATIAASLLRTSRAASVFAHEGVGVFAEEQAKTEATVAVTDSTIGRNEGPGIALRGGKLELTRVRLHDHAKTSMPDSGSAIVVAAGPTRPSELTAAHTLVERSFGAAIRSVGATLTLDACHVRDTDGAGDDGNAVHLDRGSLSAVRSLFERNRTATLRALGAQIALDRCVIRDSLASHGDEPWGVAIDARANAGQPSELSMIDSSIARSVGAAVVVLASRATMDRSTVIDTSTLVPTGAHGQALWVDADDAGGAELAVRDSMILRAHGFGVLSLGGNVSLERTEILDIRESADEVQSGVGVLGGLSQNDVPSSLSIFESAIVRVHTAAIGAVGARLVVDRSYIDGVLPDVRGALGDGIVAITRVTASGPVLAEGTISNTVVANAARAGIGAFGAHLKVEGVRVSCAAVHLDIEAFGGAMGAMDDGGGNHCGCGEALDRCAAQSANLSVLGAPDEP